MNTKKVERILIVEDDRSLVRLYQTKLEKTGYTIHVAYDGEQCFEILGDFTPDLILLDVILPKIDGFEVLKRLKTDTKTQNIPIILLTNLGQDEDIEKGKKLGAIDYLIKAQFTPSEIVKKIEAI